MQIAHRLVLKAIIMISTIALIVSAILLGPRPIAYNWKAMAQQDLMQLHKHISIHHPASVLKKEFTAFNEWLFNGYVQALKLADRTQRYEDYLYTLQYYINGFKDPVHFTFNRHILAHLPVATQWCGLHLAYQNNGVIVIDKDKHNATAQRIPLGAQLTHVDNKPVEHYLLSTIFPYKGIPYCTTLDGQQHHFLAEWIKATPNISLYHLNSFHPAPKKFTFKHQAQTLTITPQWQAIPRESVRKLRRKSFYRYDHIAIKDLSPAISWINLPTFWLNKKHLIQEFKSLVEQLPRLRAKKLLIFDLRGNGGGNYWLCQKLLVNLYGKGFVEAQKLPSINRKRHVLLTDYTVTHFYEDMKKTLSLQPEKLKAFRRYQIEPELEALKQNKQFFTYHFNGLPKQYKPPFSPTHLFNGKAIVVSDHQCGSAALAFIDDLLRMPNTLHVGQETSADTPFVEGVPLRLSSDLVTVVIPRAYREQYGQLGVGAPIIPTYSFPGNIADSKSLEKWVLSTSKV